MNRKNTAAYFKTLLAEAESFSGMIAKCMADPQSGLTQWNNILIWDFKESADLFDKILRLASYAQPKDKIFINCGPGYALTATPKNIKQTIKFNFAEEEREDFDIKNLQNTLNNPDPANSHIEIYRGPHKQSIYIFAKKLPKNPADQKISAKTKTVKIKPVAHENKLLLAPIPAIVKTIPGEFPVSDFAKFVKEKSDPRLWDVLGPYALTQLHERPVCYIFSGKSWPIFKTQANRNNIKIKILTPLQWQEHIISLCADEKNKNHIFAKCRASNEKIMDMIAVPVGADDKILHAAKKAILLIDHSASLLSAFNTAIQGDGVIQCNIQNMQRLSFSSEFDVAMKLYRTLREDAAIGPLQNLKYKSHHPVSVLTHLTDLFSVDSHIKNTVIRIENFQNGRHVFAWNFELPPTLIP